MRQFYKLCVSKLLNVHILIIALGDFSASFCLDPDGRVDEERCEFIKELAYDRARFKYNMNEVTETFREQFL